MSQIYCTVNNCHYWKKSNICDAAQILVVSDQFGASQPDTVDAPLASTLQATPTNTCMETCCKTFVDKNSGQMGVDGVIKA